MTATMAMNNKPFVITLDFQQHTAGAYRAIHHKLNAHYGGIIIDIDDLFSADGTDLPAMITAKVIDHMNLPTEMLMSLDSIKCIIAAL